MTNRSWMGAGGGVMHSARRLAGWTVLVAALAVAALAIACGDDDDDEGAAPAATTAPEAAAPEPIKVGFLYVGTVDDGGYNQAAYLGEVAVNDDPMFETINAENVPESAEAERVMQQMIADGATIIFPTSFGHLDPAIRVAEQHPDVTFLHQGGLRTTENVGTYFGTIWEVEYLAGIAAGRMTETNKLGFVVAFPIPQTLLNINAFHLGARSVNPDVTTTVVFTANWCDPAKNVEATESLAAQGIDLITQHQDCPVPVIEHAREVSHTEYTTVLRQYPEHLVSEVPWMVSHCTARRVRVQHGSHRGVDRVEEGLF